MHFNRHCNRMAAAKKQYYANRICKHENDNSTLMFYVENRALTCGTFMCHKRAKIHHRSKEVKRIPSNRRPISLIVVDNQQGNVQ